MLLRTEVAGTIELVRTVGRRTEGSLRDSDMGLLLNALVPAFDTGAPVDDDAARSSWLPLPLLLLWLEVVLLLLLLLLLLLSLLSLPMMLTSLISKLCNCIATL